MNKFFRHYQHMYCHRSTLAFLLSKSIDLPGWQYAILFWRCQFCRVIAKCDYLISFGKQRIRAMVRGYEPRRFCIDGDAHYGRRTNKKFVSENRFAQEGLARF